MESKKRSNTASLLLFNSGYIYRRLRKEAAGLGIKWTTLTLLKDIELLGPVTQKQLASENHLSGPTVSVLINGMIEEGLVSRTVNPNDKRSSTLLLSKKGAKRLEREGSKLQESLLPLLSSLTNSEVENLLNGEYALSKLFRS